MSKLYREAMASSSETAIKQPLPSLMTIPRELRNHIFHFLFSGRRVHLQRFYVPVSTIGTYKPLHIAPLLVSKQFREECIVEYLRNSHIYIDNEMDLYWAKRELRTLFKPPVELCHHIRVIEFYMKEPIDAVVYIEFLWTCRNLKELTIKLAAGNYLRTQKPDSLGTIRQAFQLHLLEQHVMPLEKFDLYWPGDRYHAIMRQLRISMASKLVAEKWYLKMVEDENRGLLLWVEGAVAKWRNGEWGSNAMSTSHVTPRL
jgi:hypothetical protein